ncbi:hypothetical protein JCM5353_000669 [Sporobolomyces roseus]
MSPQLNPLLDIACCICSAKGIVVICSGFLAATYLVACYGLREVAFPVLKKLHEDWKTYTIINQSKIPVMDWINEIKVLFYGALVYAAIGLAGLLGALLEIQLFLWPYCAYLIVSAYLGGKRIWDVLQSFLEFQDKVKNVCNKAGDILGFDCDQAFEDAKTYTYWGGGAIALLMLTTLICTLVLIRRIHKETGSYLFTFCGTSCTSCGGEKDEDDSNALGKGWEMQRRRRGRVRRGRGEGGEEEIQLMELVLIEFGIMDNRIEVSPFIAIRSE